MKSETEDKKSFPLPTAPEGVIPSLIERFNSRNVSTQMELHDPQSVFVENDGRILTDRAAIAARLERDLKLGLPLAATVRHIFVADNIAQIVVDWSIDGVGPDGSLVHLAGSACDIVRRGEDGFWRYLIDNNQGTAVR
ncbi:nuclear transport factor 2 family protein [Chitinophaga filiformis]|uniref:YybH family protein n=1 Tax=Chitinophaga filiformis TaxID=104663 RepID=UPI001F3946FF|nr:nuclear transport factor 2 family protein [Chitinophaga filiformis]MCF6405070.1 nuclear transport factor 2 family protein [Chitinophaga filiformis]